MLNNNPFALKIVVASRNPVKINATKQAFEAVFFKQSFEVIGISVASEVSDQPMTDQETLTGAKNRIKNAQNAVPDADFWVGIEGGVQTSNGQLEAFGYTAIAHQDQLLQSKSAIIPLPTELQRRILAGEEMGPVMDDLFKDVNTKQKGGAVGLLTNGLVSRADLYYQPLVMALIPLMHPSLFKKG